MKKIYWVLIILVLAILAATAFFLYEWNRPNARTADVEAVYTLTAETLTQELATDTENASAKYSGQVIAVSGEIDELDTGPDGNISVIFATDAAEVQCTLERTENKKAGQLTAGQRVSIKGKFTGYIAGDDLGGIVMPGQAKLNNCVLMDN